MYGVETMCFQNLEPLLKIGKNSDVYKRQVHGFLTPVSGLRQVSFQITVRVDYGTQTNVAIQATTKREE